MRSPDIPLPTAVEHLRSCAYSEPVHGRCLQEGEPFADAVAPAIALAQAIARLGNYFNQELFGSPTTVPWALEVFLRTPGGVAGTTGQCGTGEFPTTWIKADPTVLCGTYHPTFLYELLWDIGFAVLVVWLDRRFRLGLRRLCRWLHRWPDLDRDAAHRPREPYPRHSGQRIRLPRPVPGRGDLPARHPPARPGGTLHSVGHRS